MMPMGGGAADDGNMRESSGNSASAEKEGEGASGGNKDAKTSHDKVSDFVWCHYSLSLVVCEELEY